MIRWLLTAVFGEQHDPAWKATGIRRTFDGHDEQKAEQAQERADREAVKRRKLADRFAPPKPKKAKKPGEILAMPTRRGRP